MSFLGDVYRGRTHVDFPRLWRYAAVLSVVLVLISIGGLVGRGLNLRIEKPSVVRSGVHIRFSPSPPLPDRLRLR